jgi:hypothetical protein
MIDPAVSQTPTSLLPQELVWLIPIAGVIAMLWGHIRTIWGHLTGFVIAEVKVDTDLVYPLLRLLKKEGKALPFNVRHFRIWMMRNKNSPQWEPTLGEVPPLRNRFFWVRKSLIFVKSDSRTLSIVYARWLFDAVRFLEDLTRALKESRRSDSESFFSRFRVTTIAGEGSVHARNGGRINPKADSSGAPPSGQLAEERLDVDYLRSPQYDHETRELVAWKGGVRVEDFQTQAEKEDPYASLALPEHFHSVRADMAQWFKSAQWYQDRGIAWRRGYLFHGTPGGGKTSLAAALAREFSLPLIVFDISSMSNSEFQSSWSEQLSTPCIALIEDIHAVFDRRKNLAGDLGGGLTFDCLLNVIGGAQTNNGVVVIVTTNEPDKLDPALGRPNEDGSSSRPGRLDRAFYFGPPTAEQKRQLAAKFKLSEEDTETVIAGSHAGESYAQFSERCISVALSRYWTNQKQASSV